MKNVFKGEKNFNNTSRERTKKEETEKIRERLRKTKEANVRNYYEQRRKQKQEKFKERDDTIIRNGCVLVHKQKHFDDFVLQKELSLRARRHVTCHTHNLRACTRERERERSSTSRLRVHEGPVLQRFRRFTAHSFDSVRLVFVVAALVKRDLRVAFKRDDVGGDFVEEPSVVGDNESATVPGE